MKGWIGGSRFSLLLMALIAVSMFVYWSQIGDRNVRIPAAAPVAGAQSQLRDSVGFSSTRNLDEHYEKHGHEFGTVTRQQYLAMALALRDVAAGGPVLGDALAFLGCRVAQRLEGPDHWIIYAEVEQGNVSDTEASTAIHHRKVGNHY